MQNCPILMGYCDRLGSNMSRTSVPIFVCDQIPRNHPICGYKNQIRSDPMPSVTRIAWNVIEVPCLTSNYQCMEITRAIDVPWCSNAIQEVQSVHQGTPSGYPTRCTGTPQQQIWLGTPPQAVKHQSPPNPQRETLYVINPTSDSR